MRYTEEITLRFASQADTPHVIALWSLCFPGEETFRDYFFSRLYCPENNLLLLKGSELCAMAQMLPYEMQNGPDTEIVTYIYGACTHPAHRRQHLMDLLLHRSFAIDRANGRAASILIPQEEWLFGFYAQFGYEPAFRIAEMKTDCLSAAAPCAVRPVQEGDLSELDALYHRALGAGPYIRRPEAEWRKQLSLFTHTGGEVLCAEQQGAITGYAFVYPTKEEIFAQELVCASDTQAAWTAALQERYGQPKCRLNGLQFPRQRPFGCMLRYDNARPTDGYINLMLN